MELASAECVLVLEKQSVDYVVVDNAKDTKHSSCASFHVVERQPLSCGLLICWIFWQRSTFLCFKASLPC
jgi:hypothetical protein